jgi:nicastrin
MDGAPLSTIANTPCTALFTRSTFSPSFFGCSTADKNKAIKGALISIHKQTDLDAFLASSNTEERTAILDPSLLSPTTLTALTAKGVAAVITYGTTPNSAPTTPNGAGTPSASLNPDTHAYNPSGTGLESMNLHGVPVVHLSDSDTLSSLRLLAEENSDRGEKPFHAAAFDLYMGPEAANSESCLAWRGTDGTGSVQPQCKPLGGQSVWATFDGGATSSDAPLTMLATGIDSTAMFHENAPSATGAASDIIALLLAAKSIGSLSDDVKAKLQKRIGFGFFQGETYGFLGSQAFFRDTNGGFKCRALLPASNVTFDEDHDTCLAPLYPSLAFTKLPEITTLLTVDQVGTTVSGAGGDFFSTVHDTDASSQLESILAATQVGSSSRGVTPATLSRSNLPPTPLTSFVNTSPSPSTVSGAVLSGYDSAFVGDAYHSGGFSDVAIFDNIAAAATIAARAAVADALVKDGVTTVTQAVAAADTAVADITADDETLRTLYDCFVSDGNCQYLQTAVEAAKQTFKDRYGFPLSYYKPLGSPPNYYVDVYATSLSQPYVIVENGVYGAYSDADAYAKAANERRAYIGLQPSQLEVGLQYFLNEHVGNGNFHNAVDRGVTPKNDTKPAFWELVDDVTDTPLWTEPNWASLDVVVFMDGDGWEYGEAGFVTMGILLLLGVLLGTRVAISKMKKDKVL